MKQPGAKLPGKPTTCHVNVAGTFCYSYHSDTVLNNTLTSEMGNAWFTREIPSFSLAHPSEKKTPRVSHLSNEFRPLITNLHLELL